jgi:CubicO group peptidase (beta-lactamase class C family)
MRMLALAVASLVSVSTLAADPLPRATPESVGMSSQRLARIDQAMKVEIDQGRTPGAVIAIARRGKLVYYKAYGWLDKDAGTKMTTDAIFSIASMTKPMVTVGALDLFEHGRLKLDEPVATYLPQLAKVQVAVLKANDAAQTYETVAPVRAPTIIDLMRHTSGWAYGGRGTTPVHKMYPASSSAAALAMTGKEFVDKLATLPLLHQPGARWEYGLDVLGQVIEKVSGQTLGEYLQGQLWKPLGMVDTAFQVPPEKLKRYAKGFAKDPDTGQPQFVLDLSKPLMFQCGGGCTASTAADYLRFAQMLLNGGTLGGKRILGRKTVEFMLSDQLPPGTVSTLATTGDATRADYGFGLGVAVRTTPGVVRLTGSVGDFSWSGAYGTTWWGDPKEKLAVVFMAQTPGPIRWHYRHLIGGLVNQAIVD